MKCLLDRVVRIDHSNGIEAATEFPAAHGDACVLSATTRAEALAGFDGGGARLALELLNLFVTFPVTVEVADMAAALRRSQRWKLPDALQAAIAKHHELVLVTRNTCDFQAGGTPEVWVPYRL